MALTPKRKMTEKKLAANRINARKSQGAVTPEGKRRAARANLRHGFYAQQAPEVLTALGEDPAEFLRLAKSLQDNLAEGLEGELVRRTVRTLWLMQRADHMQDGLALKRVQTGLLVEDVMLAPRLLKNDDIYERLCGLGRLLNGPHPFPSPTQIQAFVDGIGADPPAEIQSLFPLLRTYGELTAKAAGVAHENGGPDSTVSPDPRQEAARQELSTALHAVAIPYAEASDRLMAESDKIRTPENIAAHMAPKDENSLYMQRMEDSHLRRLWRLTNMLVKVRSGALT